MQYVKAYKDIIGDRRFNQVDKTAIEQINEDLRDEKQQWTIEKLVIDSSTKSIIVVFDVQDNLTTKLPTDDTFNEYGQIINKVFNDNDPNTIGAQTTNKKGE